MRNVTRKAEDDGVDFFPTPPHATYALVQMEKRWIDRHMAESDSFVWEPAAGRGWMSRELMRLGYRVLSSDLIRHPDPFVPIVEHDFLKERDPITTARLRPPPAIITNPPYARGQAQAFAERAIAFSPYVAMLCRTTWVESQGRYEFFKAHPPTRILFFSRRISCTESLFGTGKENGGIIAYAWFIWDRLRDGTGVDWINPNVYEEWKRSTDA